MDEFIRELGEWGIATFPHSNAVSIAKHLQEEAREVLERAEELAEAAPVCNQRASWVWSAMGEEMADVLLLLLHLAHREKIDVLAEARLKFERNRAAKWEYDAEKGYSKRVKPEAKR